MKEHLLSCCLLLTSVLSHAADFTLSSQDIHEGATLSLQQVYQGLGCHGGNISPQLSWKGAPAGSKSFAITVYDPDARSGNGWWHWTVFNLPAKTDSLPTGAGSRPGLLPPSAIQGRTDFGSNGFGGACPPVGDKPHHYQFTVWALKTDTLPLDANASAALLGFMLNANALAHARLTALYGR